MKAEHFSLSLVAFVSCPSRSLLYSLSSFVPHVWTLFSKVVNVGSNSDDNGYQSISITTPPPFPPHTHLLSSSPGRPFQTCMTAVMTTQALEMVGSSNPPDLQQYECTEGTRENDPPTGNFADYRSNK